jgi:exonuclease III
MKTLTWNINRRNSDRAFRHVITKEKAQIILLQECFHPLTYLSENEFAKLKGRFLWTPTRNGWGNCIVTPQSEIREIGIQHEFKGRLQVATTNISKIEKITIANLHVPITDGYSRFNMVKMFEIICKRIKNGNALICGDFNFGECFDRRGETEHRDIFRNLLEKYQITDCYRKFHKTFGRTFRPVRKSKTIIGIDYILVSNDLVNRLKSCRVLDDKKVEEMSDHNPIVAVFE